LTKNIDLVLGKNVLPKPGLDANIWQSDNGGLTLSTLSQILIAFGKVLK